MFGKLTKKVSRFAGVGALILGLGLFTGCVILDEEPLPDAPGYYLADLEVNWTVDGSSATSLCDRYGIQSWLVTVNGPEKRTVEVECRIHYWSSESDLYSLTEGKYDVTVTGVDGSGHHISTISTALDLYDDGPLNILDFDFQDSDF